MSPPDNILAQIIALRQEIENTRKKKTVLKDDVIDLVNQRSTEMLRSFVTQPFHTSFFFPIKAPAESDQFDRLALRLLEERS
jgi:hypothetical protein